MPNPRDKVPPEDVDGLLHDSETVHVVHVHPASEPREENMQRLKALAHVQKHGAFLSGPLAREANHGICSPSGGAWAFFETNHG